MSWILDFFGFGNGTSSNGILVLEPDVSGKQLAGFGSGKPLELTANPGETIGSVMEKFNKYRGPDQQIKRLWNQRGEDIPFSTVMTGRLTAIVKSSMV